jgi:SAM-dependent methyltransferase
LSFGPEAIKRSVWEKEYKTSKWDFNLHTDGDPVYSFLERYTKKGSILDLGCGSGNTSIEIANSAYTSYLGVDISSEALTKAAQRSEENGRAGKNRFQQSDFMSFHTPEHFDVILFRESMYHVPISRISSLLGKYSQYLKGDGVFIVRLSTKDNGEVKNRPTKMIETIADNLEVIERSESGEKGTVVIVFRPRMSARRQGRKGGSEYETNGAVMSHHEDRCWLDRQNQLPTVMFVRPC